MKGFTVFELSKMLNEGKISSVELTKSYIDKINEKNGELNAFITVTADSALLAAAESDNRRAEGKTKGILDGIPFSVKDNICTEGVRTTCGSRMLANFVPPYTAYAVEQLVEAGAVLLGKTNLDEFGMGSATDTSFFGTVKNPLDLSRTAGGSSGGGAAALAADMCAFSIGTDTGGSVRQPAAFCGLVGMRPTYGTVSRYGLIAYASSFDCMCPITTDIKDSMIVLDAMRSRDKRDMTCVDISRFPLEALPFDEKITVGVPYGMLEEVDSDVRDAVLLAARAFEKLGATVKAVSLPDERRALVAYYVICCAEASSNLSRYDGVRYGCRTDKAVDADALFTFSRTEGFGDEVKRRIMLGTECLTGEGRNRYYKRALAEKLSIKRSFERIFKECDVVLMPNAPTSAYRFSQKKQEALEVWLEDSFCVFASLAGLPAISVPFGVSREGLPVGVQLMGAPFSENKLYAAGLCIEGENERADR